MTRPAPANSSAAAPRPRRAVCAARVQSRLCGLLCGGSRRALSVCLVVVMLAAQTPASPLVLASLASRWRADFAFWAWSGGWPASLSGALAGQSGRAAAAQEKQSERDARVRRVAIHPGDVTLRIGERVNFAAVAYDGENGPVGGVGFTWSVREAGSGRRERVSRTGEFIAQAAGRYRVTAEGAGRHAQVNVFVPETPGWRGRGAKPQKVEPVSTREQPPSSSSLTPGEDKKRRGRPAVGAGGPHFVKASHGGAPARGLRLAVPSPARTLLDYEYQWNEGNFREADDPDNRRGTPPGAAADGGAGSGNFQLAAPVAALPGRGLDLSLGLAYNSRVWNKANGEMAFDMDRDWPAPGWSLGFGKMIGLGASGALLIDADGTRHGFTGTITTDYYGNKFFNGHTADGTFIDYWHAAYADGRSAGGGAKLPNGTVIEYGAVGQNIAYPTSITDANGNRIVVTYRNNAGPQIETVTDTLGRVVAFHYDANGLLTAVTGPGLGGGTRTLVRLHYKQHVLDYSFSLPARVQSGTVPLIDAIYYPATGTGYWFGDFYSYSSYGMIAKVSERRGMGFSANSLNEQGTITSEGAVTRQVDYDYPLAATPGSPLGDAPTYPKMTETWEGRDTEPAETLYDVHQDSTPRRTEITLPNGVRSTQYSYNAPGQFNDGLVYLDETKDAAGTLLQSSRAQWAQGAYSSPRPVKTEAVDHEINKKTVAVFEYGPVYNQVIAVHDYDYADVNAEPTNRLRVTRTEYENGANYTGRHIFNLVKKVSVFAGDDQTRVSQTEYQYDGAPLQNAPGVVMHSEQYNPHAPSEEVCAWEDNTNDPDYQNPGCNNPESPFYNFMCDGVVEQIYVCRTITAYWPPTDYRGNVTQVKTYSDAVGLTGEIVETRRYDITGNLVAASSSCCEQTSFGYALATQYAYPASQTRGSASDATKQVTTGATYDFNTGLVLTSTDANGRTAETRYYASTLRPEKDISPTGAFTLFEYDEAAMRVTETTYLSEPPSDAKIAGRGVKFLNGRGQVRREEALGAGGAVDVVETRYDKLGRVWKQTQPFRSTLAEGGWAWTENFYDDLGRVKKTVAPDGSTVETFYNEGGRPDSASSAPGQTTRARDAWGRERWGRTDAQGRLVEVVEPQPYGGGSVSEGGSLLTSYSYDTLGNIVEVAQGAQRRRFEYDSLGRLLRQKLAEAGATLNSAGTYLGPGVTGAEWSDVFAYDTRSNLVARTDARGVKTVFNYRDAANNPDPLNRLQSVSYDKGGVPEPLRSTMADAATVTYAYGVNSDGSALPNRAQLSRVTTAGVAQEVYTFDAEGRVIRKKLTLDSRPAYPLETDYEYDTLDRVWKVTYPKQYGVGVINPPRKVVEHEYDAASRLAGLKVDGASYASGLVYNAASQTTELKVGAAGANQVTESYDYDPATGLLSEQKVYRGADAPATRLLHLTYNYLRPGTTAGRTGQLTSVSDHRDRARDRSFEYDALGRLRRAAGGGTQGAWAQAYLYDRHGNRSHVLSQQTAQWVVSLFNVVWGRAGGGAEVQAKDDALRGAYAQGQGAFRQAAKDTAAGFFDSQEYANRNRSNRDYVRDLYLAYLNREPDQGGWDAWTNALDSGASRASVRSGFADSGEFSNRVAGMYPGAGAGGAGAPTGLSATESAASQITLSWAAPTSGTVSHYRVERKASAAGQYALLATTTTANHTDTQVSGDAAYLYRVSAVRADGSVSGTSNAALGTAVAFTDDPVQAGVTTVKAQHLLELRQAVNAVRRLAGLGDSAWTDAAQAGVVVRAQHVRELRERLGEALSALGLAAPAYTDPELTAGATVIKAAHFNELRQAAGRSIGAAGGGGNSTAPAAPRDGHAYLSFDAQTNRVNSPGWEYDASGNQTRVLSASGGWQRMEYDAANRLVRVKSDAGAVLASYTYSDSNARLIADEGGARTYYASEGGTTIAEYTEAGTSTVPQWGKSYVHLGGRLLATIEPGGNNEVVQYHHPDRLGTRLITAAGNASFAEQATLPYGTVLGAETTAQTSRRFTSYDRSPATGLDYAVNRRYDPLQGRFTQVDPIEMEAASLDDPQSLNLYAYCANDPVNHVDPDGLFIGRLFRAIGKAFKTVLKWVAVAVVVAVAVTFLVAAISAPGSPGALFASWMWNSFLTPLVKALGTLTGISGGSNVLAPGGTGVFNPSAGAGVGGVGGGRGFAFGFQDPVGTSVGGCGDVENPCDIGVVNSARPRWYTRIWRKTNSILDALHDYNQGVFDAALFGYNPWDPLWQLLGRREAKRETVFHSAGMVAGTLTPGPGKARLLLAGNKAHKLQHIFRAGRGHVNPRTFSSQSRYLNLFERVQMDPANYRWTTGTGVNFYTKVFRNGKQVWVEVRNGRITNAGVNLPGAHR